MQGDRPTRQGVPMTKTLTGLLVAALLGTAACGGDDALSRSDYVAELNKICRDGNAQIEKIPQPTSVDEIADFVAEAKKVTRAGVDKMADLEPPEELKDEHEAQVANGRKVVELADDLAEAAKSGDEAAFKRVSDEGDKLDKESDERAKRIGANDCADGS
jgi:hypothetical protein